MAPVPPEQDAPRPRRGRSPNMRSTIYQGNDGRWQGRVTVGIRDDGRPDRRHVRGKTRSEVAEKVRALERNRDQGTVRKVAERWTVGRWLTYWVENIAAPPHVAENTHLGYRVDVNRHLIPGLGAHRLERLTPDHVERLYAKLQHSGLSPGGVHHVHRTLRAALNEAVRRSHLTRNPVLLAKAPKLDDDDVEPYDVPEIQHLLEAAAKRRNGARWALALALGLRQGEALGLTWDDVDLDKGTIRVRRSRLRPRYAHGCGGTCGKTPGLCPQRLSTRAAAGGVKSKAGRRTIGLPPQLVALLRAHRIEQERERALARQLWHDEGWVFATPIGQPINPRTDYSEWKRLLKERRAARGATARCQAHRRHRAAGPAPADADRHVADGLVERVHGGPVPARDRRLAQSGGQRGGGPDLGLGSRQRRLGLGHSPSRLARRHPCRRRRVHRESPRRQRSVRRDTGRARRSPWRAATRDGRRRNSK